MPNDTDDFQSRLAQLTPSPAAADPVAAAYAAGRAAGRRAMAAWQGVAGLGLAAAIGSIAFRPAPLVTAGSTVVTTAAVSPAVPTPAVSADSVVVLERAVLDGGLDGLPRHPHPDIADFHLPTGS